MNKIEEPLQSFVHLVQKERTESSEKDVLAVMLQFAHKIQPSHVHLIK